MKIKVAIIGTGNIGTDLLLKALKTDFMDVVVFVGRRLDSDGMLTAKKHDVLISDQGIEYIRAPVVIATSTKKQRCNESDTFNCCSSKYIILDKNFKTERP